MASERCSGKKGAGSQDHSTEPVQEEVEVEEGPGTVVSAVICPQRQMRSLAKVTESQGLREEKSRADFTDSGN